MLEKTEYELIDFGAGRRLERFNALILDRPCPSAQGLRQGSPSVWKRADATFVERRKEAGRSRKNEAAALGVRGYWRPLTEHGAVFFSEESTNESSGDREGNAISSKPWALSVGGFFTLELKGSPFGHLGVFPEQAENWRRIYDLCQEGRGRINRPLRILNLFGYTGGSALAALAAGAEVTHVDAARNIVAMAKRNAALSFPEREVAARWIVDDAVKYVKRELKRESRYDGVILDPPTYGHGARGEVWRLSRDLEPLLTNCVNLLNDSFAFIMLTGHTPGFDAPVLERLLRSCMKKRFEANARRCEHLSQPLGIQSTFNGALPCGDLALSVLR